MAVVVLIVVFYFFFVYRPKAVEITDLKADLSEKRRDKEEKEKIVADLERFNRDVQELEKELDKVLAQLPDKKEIDQILEQLSRLIEDTGLKLEKFTVLPEVPRQLYNEVPIALEITGNYHNLALFFDKASKMERIINFTGLDLGDAALIGGETIIKVLCKATTFRFVKGAAKTPQGQKPPDKGKMK